jgi:Na+/H+-dicarboxylate symporter
MGRRIVPLSRVKRLKLHHWIILGIVLGTAAGTVLPKSLLPVCDTLGEIFIRALSMSMIPLVVGSLIGAVLSLGDPRKLGRIGAKTIGYYLLSAVVAITISLLLANVVRPHRFFSEEKRAEIMKKYADQAAAKAKDVGETKEHFTVWDFLKRIVPKNPVKAMTEDPPDMLAIIFFSLLVGLAAGLLPLDRRKPFADTMMSLYEVMLQVIQLVMLAAPICVFALMAKAVMTMGLSVIVSVLAYFVTALAAMALHFFVFYPTTVRFFSGMSPVVFWRGLRDVFLTAFSTSSSAATLPLTLKAVNENLKIPAPITNFCLSLGATINMDGTAIFQAVAVVFIAGVYGIDLSLGQHVMIVGTTLLAAIGSAPIPGAGIVMLGVIMTPLGIPLEGIALILGVDRLLDMVRTIVNVAGDAAGAVVVAATEKEAPPP